MVKKVVVELSDRAYLILEKLDEFEGDCGVKLKELFANYLAQTPRLKANYHMIKLDEKKDYLSELLEFIWKEYEKSPDPRESWDSEKYDSILEELLQINVVRPMGGGRFAPTHLFQKPWLSVYHSTSDVFPDLDEFSQAYLATLYMLDYLSRGTLEKELMRDSTIILNEFYMNTYAVAKKTAHISKQALSEKRKKLVPDSDDPVP